MRRIKIGGIITVLLAVIGLRADLAGLGMLPPLKEIPTSTAFPLITYAGRVTNNSTGESVQRAKVLLAIQGVVSIEYTDSEGVFYFPIEYKSNRIVRISVEAEGYQRYERSIQVSPQSTTIANIMLAPLAEIILNDMPSPTATIDRPTVTYQTIRQESVIVFWYISKESLQLALAGVSEPIEEVVEAFLVRYYAEQAQQKNSVKGQKDQLPGKKGFQFVFPLSETHGCPCGFNIKVRVITASGRDEIYGLMLDPNHEAVYVENFSVRQFEGVYQLWSVY